MTIAYLDGQFVPLTEARISPMDRGYLFGDAVYEVIPVYQGHIFSFTEHYARLLRSLAAIKLSSPNAENELHQMLKELVERNGGGDLFIYLQISRGVSLIRDHAFPEKSIPTVFAYSMPLKVNTIETLEKGIAVITYPDNRWQHCYIKTTNLLGNVLARQAAAEANTQEALFIHDGYAIEGTSSNLFVLHNNVVLTPPTDGHILGGVTRDFIISLARQNNIVVEETNIREELLWQANEVWVTSTMKEITPVVKVDHHVIADGIAGPVWRKMIRLYREFRSHIPSTTHD